MLLSTVFILWELLKSSMVKMRHGCQLHYIFLFSWLLKLLYGIISTYNFLPSMLRNLSNDTFSHSLIRHENFRSLTWNKNQTAFATIKFKICIV